MDGAQKALFAHWSPQMEIKSGIVMDATCYESHIRYPTNVKLLWECTDWLHGLLKKVCGKQGKPMQNGFMERLNRLTEKMYWMPIGSAICTR